MHSETAKSCLKFPQSWHPSPEKVRTNTNMSVCTSVGNRQISQQSPVHELILSMLLKVFQSQSNICWPCQAVGSYLTFQHRNLHLRRKWSKSDMAEGETGEDVWQWDVEVKEQMLNSIWYNFLHNSSPASKDLKVRPSRRKHCGGEMLGGNGSPGSSQPHKWTTMPNDSVVSRGSAKAIRQVTPFFLFLYKVAFQSI